MATEEAVAAEIVESKSTDGPEENSTTSTSTSKQLPINFFFTAQIVFIGKIEMTQQTFEARLEVPVNRELTQSELEAYNKNPSDFEPEITIATYPIGAAEILQRDLMEFNTGKTWNIFKDPDSKWRGKYALWRVWIFHCVFMEELELQNFPVLFVNHSNHLESFTTFIYKSG